MTSPSSSQRGPRPRISSTPHRAARPSRRVWGRLAVEQRIVGLLALLALIHGALSTIWITLALPPEALALLTTPQVLGSLLAVLLTAIIGCVLHVSLRLPEIRWARPDGDPGPKVWLLALLGLPSLLVWPILLIRDGRAKRQLLAARASHESQDHEIEHGFRQLLATPRDAALLFAIWLGLASVVAVLLVVNASGDASGDAGASEARTAPLLLALVFASLLPLVSVATSRIRAMLVPEYLAAPRADPLALPVRRSVALRLGGPAALALIGAVTVPALAAALWTGAHASAGTELLAPVGLASVALGLVAGLLALVLLLRDLERDLGRASRQIAAVAEGEVPEPMAVETFATAELRGLVAAVDRLVGRISDANVAKYVLIEKGQEADRLKSQFLANMSHDLRSPLNSVLGFSELLATGIEGELSSAQGELVGTIHRTGQDLLQQIDDILDTAKIEAGRMELHREPTPPATLIAKAIRRTRVRLDRPIEFDTTFAPGVPPAFVDPYRTVQAIENVLLFAAEGLQHGTIEISCEAPQNSNSGREIVLRIVSPRALVPLAELEQARRGFFRLPGHTGLGLGLPIATSILELQGGDLLIEGGASNSLGGRAAMGFELHMPALTARRVSRPRIAPE